MEILGLWKTLSFLGILILSTLILRISQKNKKQRPAGALALEETLNIGNGVSIALVRAGSHRLLITVAKGTSQTISVDDSFAARGL